MSNPFLASFALHVLQSILNDRTLRNSKWCSSRSRTRRLLRQGGDWWWRRERDENWCWLRWWDYERWNGLDDDSSWHCSLSVNHWNSRCSRNDGVCCWYTSPCWYVDRSPRAFWTWVVEFLAYDFDLLVEEAGNPW
jgi:hypothetical protein